jgi:hypothetical protein
LHDHDGKPRQDPQRYLVRRRPKPAHTRTYRPLPDNTGLGLNAFNIALLTLMCGFIGATIVNSVVDSALGYATTDLGPRWRQRQPVPINRWQTLLIKWAIIAVLTAVLPAVMLLVAWGVGMDMPYPWLLWAFTWLCALTSAPGRSRGSRWLPRSHIKRYGGTWGRRRWIHVARVRRCALRSAVRHREEPLDISSSKGTIDRCLSMARIRMARRSLRRRRSATRGGCGR